MGVSAAAKLSLMEEVGQLRAAGVAPSSWAKSSRTATRSTASSTRAPVPLHRRDPAFCASSLPLPMTLRRYDDQQCMPEVRRQHQIYMHWNQYCNDHLAVNWRRESTTGLAASHGPPSCSKETSLERLQLHFPFSDIKNSIVL